ncbi:DUF1501 domain-containing protein [Labrenzia sp. VG12]|uniref:DUF1501 domain-containing protein n=1 Tax=Labrenzia sp. VG12 TaxID=2021862 RepID=UPI000B8BEF1F|nr:DUF1501 domain-containing protein [Labrenzia sp. VG12]ASP35315.1 twin-arginine translocation pathway signal protein [Labrenzia sp. VG12]
MSRLLSPSRRRFLQALGVGVTSALPSLGLPGFLRAAEAAPTPDHLLVLVELAGGNDGLNTHVPHKDPQYRHLRPEIGLDTAQLIMLDGETGLHPSLKPLGAHWERGELQIVEGVGYPNPNRSHFRSIEIWNSGGGPDSLSSSGWISSALSIADRSSRADADGLVLGGEMGPLAGPGRFSAIRDVDAYLGALDLVGDRRHPVRPASTHSPMQHVLDAYESAQVTGEQIRKKLDRYRGRRWAFPETGLGDQLHVAARLLDAGVEVPVIKVVQDGYDTHEGQSGTHAALLDDLSTSLHVFAEALRQIGLWHRTTIVTYSEFGRRARENGSAGTDHGTAAPVIVLGGSVAGGLGGRRPSLDSLVDDDLVFTTDYREVYHALLRDLWGLEAGAYDGFEQQHLRILKS